MRNVTLPGDTVWVLWLQVGHCNHLVGVYDSKAGALANVRSEDHFICTTAMNETLALDLIPYVEPPRCRAGHEELNM
ncbi:MAG TPA: hypothetical protein VGK94_07895 [Candidatus Polarisedimenticolia bacterium]